MLFCFAGCEKEKNSSESAQTDLASKYYEYAQSCISENDTEKAKEVLKEGIEKTKSSVLSDLLSEIDKTDSKAESTVSYEYGKVAGLDFSYWKEKIEFLKRICKELLNQNPPDDIKNNDWENQFKSFTYIK